MPFFTFLFISLIFFPPESTQDSMTCNKIKAEFIEFAYSQADSQQKGLGSGFMDSYF